ncbi:hypothetical protein CDAR_96221 [Caerostris darwini]|uniref:Ribosomal protein S14 n=1 Tax=Caerostris darwini TaxID=1538125 RepID=A0AAV4TM68_9ARAC|nr:hypothetical protein CDAR_96221 [Caerostris darwini]
MSPGLPKSRPRNALIKEMKNSGKRATDLIRWQWVNCKLNRPRGIAECLVRSRRPSCRLTKHKLHPHLPLKSFILLKSPPTSKSNHQNTSLQNPSKDLENFPINSLSAEILSSGKDKITHNSRPGATHIGPKQIVGVLRRAVYI